MILGACWGTNAPAQAPLSAIQWLRDPPLSAERGTYALTPPVSSENAISVRALDALRPEAVGLYPAARVGLPGQIWGPSNAGELTRAIAALPDDTLPALRELAYRLLLAEFEAPLPSISEREGPGQYLQARVDRLVAFGALDQAAALLDTLEAEDPALRLARFRIALLLGDEATACATLLRPGPTVSDAAALIYCHARAGDWARAEGELASADERGLIHPYSVELLEAFLHGESRLPGSASLLPPPEGVPDPLTWRLLEALGDPVTTLGLPLAYAHADLRGTIGWRAQIEAAERLVRSGALSPNRLLGLYTDRRAAASGGIWERVRTVQRLDVALAGDDADAVGRALVAAWPQIESGELEVPLASIYAEHVARHALGGEAAALAFRVGLLSEAYETVALGLAPDSAPEDRFLAAIARGLDPLEAGSMPGETARAVAVAFGPAPADVIPADVMDRLAQGRLGQVLLETLDGLGGTADPRLLTEGLSILRHVGLEDIARRAALQSLLLERRG
ncbi:MAG: hypothetical protein R3D60_11055 [Paracoccaceae bacterium]